MQERLLGGFRLGEYHVEPLTGKVTGPRGARHLPPKALEVLLCLATSPWSLVTRDDLLHSVWGEAGRQEALSRAVSELRQALDDHPNDPKFIQTLPKRGYRLLVQVTLEPRGEPPPTGASQPTAPPTAAPPTAAPQPAAPQPAAPQPAAPPTERGVRFFGELRRRGVIETGFAYLVSGWLLIQIAVATFDQLSLPPWSTTFVTYLVIVGFPIALTLAWFIRITSKGAVLDLGPDSSPERKPFSRPYVAILAALASAAVGVFAYDQYVGLPRQAAAKKQGTLATEIPVNPSSIAVLPFLNIGDSDVGRIFAEGLAEDVTDRLAKVPGLKVSSRGDAFSLPPNSPSPDVRRRLRVAYYLEGSVRLSGDSLRVVVQLIDSADGFHVVSRHFDRERKDFFAIQDEITSLTVANLRVALPAAMPAVIGAAAENPNLDAYVLYRRGMDELHKPVSQETIAGALDDFKRALGLDADYAAADAGICITYASGYSLTKDPAYIDEAEKACSAALSLNSNLDVVHNALGELYLQTGRYEDAEAAFKRALAINGSATSALIGLGNVYSARQRMHEAEQAFRQAIDLQPGNWKPYNALGSLLYYNGRYEEAAKDYRKVVSLDGRNTTGWSNLAASLTLSGAFGEAAIAEQRAIDIQPSPTAYSNLGLLHYYLGEIDLAVASLEKAIDMAPKDYLGWSNLGDVLSFSEHPEKADQAFARAEELAGMQLQVNGRDAQTIYNCGWIKAMRGKFGEAERLIATARDIAPGDPYLYYIDALILVRRGRPAKAIAELETAVEKGYPVALVAAEPHLRALRDEPRFRALIRERGR